MGQPLTTPVNLILLMSPAAVLVAFAACGTAAPTTGASGSGGSATVATGTGGTTQSTGTGGSTASFTTLSGGTGGTSSGGLDGGCGMTVLSECKVNAECDDSDPTTTDSCSVANPGTEFPSGVCLHVACDGGPSCVTQAVDPGCAMATDEVVYPPFIPLTPPGVPLDCKNGFDLFNAAGAPNYVIQAVPAAGSRALTLDLDMATYVAPDGLLITGVDGDCKKYVLFDSCRLETADKSQGAYTDGMTRPLDEALRQFHLTLRPGTTSLTFDVSRVVSPMYFRVLGLCDFALPPAAGVGWFALVP